MNYVEKSSKLDARTKWSYCVGSTGRDMAYTLVSMYLITYIQYTMKLTVAQFGTITAIIVACLVWDAINDPLMGILIENCHMKLGKFRPWILIGMLLNAVILITLFTIRPQGWAFVAFFGVSYLCWGMTYTMNDISYWGMLPSLTSDAKERNSLVTIMSIFICIGQFSVAGILPTIVAGNAVNAYRMAALVVALCFLLFQLVTFFGVKERPRRDNPNKLSLKGMFSVFKRNDQLVIIGIALLLFNIGNGLLILFGMNFFYFEYGYREGGNLVLIFTIMFGLGTLISQAIFSALSARFSRMQLLKAVILGIWIGYGMLLLFGYALPKNAVLLNVIGFLIYFSQGIYGLSQKITALEIEAGKGTIGSEEVFVQAGEYVNQVQPNQTLLLRIGMVAVPLTAMTICYVLVKKKYIISEQEYQRMVDAIEKN